MLWARNINYGAAFAVNDNLSVSYQETESLRKVLTAIADGTGSSDSILLQADTISVAYTIGGLSIKYADSSVDNDTYTADTTSTASTLSIGVAY